MYQQHRSVISDSHGFPLVLLWWSVVSYLFSSHPSSALYFYCRCSYWVHMCPKKNDVNKQHICFTTTEKGCAVQHVVVVCIANKSSCCGKHFCLCILLQSTGSVTSRCHFLGLFSLSSAPIEQLSDQKVRTALYWAAPRSEKVKLHE